MFFRWLAVFEVVDKTVSDEDGEFFLFRYLCKFTIAAAATCEKIDRYDRVRGIWIERLASDRYLRNPFKLLLICQTER
jgi:hypothetical protein